MSKSAVTGVLGLLRRLKTTPSVSLDHAAIEFLKIWAADHTPGALLRLSAAIIEEVADAKESIAQSSLTDEAKEGLLATLAGLSSAFSLNHLFNNAVKSFVPAIDSSITNFAIICAMLDATVPPAALDELSALIAEVEALHKTIVESSVDPAVKAASARHVAILLAMLRNVEAVGIEPAMAAYFELVWRLRRSDGADGTETRKATDGFWTRVQPWGDRLTNIANLMDGGAKLLPYVEKVPDLLKYMPF